MVSTLQILVVAIGTFAVSFLVSAIAPTGGLQLAVIAATLPAPVAIPVHAWITGCSALFRSWNFRSSIDCRYVAAFAPVSLLASVLGVSIALRLDPAILQILVGLFILQVSLRQSRSDPPYHRRAFASHPMVAAGITGFATVFVGATGPLLFALMARRFDEKADLMGTFSACLTIQHFSKVVLFGAMGAVVLEYPTLLATALVASWCGTWLGSFTLTSISEMRYRLYLKIAMSLMGTFLVVQGLIQL